MSRFQNPVLKKIKDGDIVLMKMEARFEAPTVNLVRINNPVLIPAGEEYDGTTLDYDWLNYDANVLYTNKRMHESGLDSGICNCLGIEEIVPEELLDNYIKNYNLFDPRDHLLSDEEIEQKMNKLKLEIGMG